MTENEAKTKWCPLARSTDEHRGSGDWKMVVVNRQDDGSPDLGCMCLGSKCMFWRWSQEIDKDYNQSRLAEFAGSPRPWKDSTTDGYCGAAR